MGVCYDKDTNKEGKQMNESKKTPKDLKEEAIVAIVLCLLTAIFSFIR